MRGLPEGEPSQHLCGTGVPGTRDSRPRQLPTDTSHAAPTRECQSDPPSLPRDARHPTLETLSANPRGALTFCSMSDVMGYEMLSGVLPFTGPHLEDFREQHLHSDLPSFANIDASLAAIIEACLIKASGARPLPADLLARLEQAGAGVVPPGLARLKEANRNESTRIATAARRASQASTEGERRADLFVAASKSLRTMCNTLIETVGAAAPDSESRAQLDGPWAIKLGAAELRIFSPQEHARSQASDQRIPFDVVAFTDIELSMPPDHYGYSGRSHALWFCDAQQAGSYAWFETAFMLQALMAQQSNRDPFSLKPGAEAGESVGPGMNAYQVAWPFTKLDYDSLEDFINR